MCIVRGIFLAAGKMNCCKNVAIDSVGIVCLTDAVVCYNAND